MVSVVCAHGPRHVHQRRHCELHQSALRRCESRLRASPKAGGAATERQSRAKSSCRATSHIIHHTRRQALLWSRVPPAKRKNGKPSSREAADEAFARFANRSAVEEQSFQLELEE